VDGQTTTMPIARPLRRWLKNIMHIKLPVQISAKMTVVTFSDIWCTWLSSLA